MPNQGLQMFSSVYCEKYANLHLHPQCNYKKLSLAKFYYSTFEIKTNVLSLVICEYGISMGWGGRGPKQKIMEIPGGGGSTMKPLGMENPGGWGVKLEKTLCGGFGYCLEPNSMKN